MSISDDETKRILELQTRAERQYASLARAITPESERAIRELQERMDAVVNSPGLKAFFEQQERMRELTAPALRAWLDQQEAMQRAVSSLGQDLLAAQFQASAAMEDIAQSLSMATKAISTSIFSTDFLEGLHGITAAHEVEQAKLGAFLASVASTTTKSRDLSDLFGSVDLKVFYGSCRHIEEIARAAEVAMGRVEYATLGSRLQGIDAGELGQSVTRLNLAYGRFATDAALSPIGFGEAPFMAEIPTLAVYSHARVVRSVSDSPDRDEPAIEIWGEVCGETTAVIETILPRIRPALLTSWRGGLARTRRRGDDWVRQASSSLRYVLIETLNTIAPKERVLADGVDRKHLSEKGEPTRAGQVHWLCRPLKNKTYREMMVAELESAIEIIDTMNAAVHRDDHPEIEEAFDRMCVRAEIALRDLLEIFNTRH